MEFHPKANDSFQEATAWAVTMVTEQAEPGFEAEEVQAVQPKQESLLGSSVERPIAVSKPWAAPQRNCPYSEAQVRAFLPAEAAQSDLM